MNFESPYVALPGRLTVRQNLRVFAELYGVPDVEARIVALAEELDLVEFIDREAGKLSAGQEDPRCARQGADQRAGGAAPRRADGLARPGQRRLDPLRASSAYCETYGATILLASHNMLEVERLCDDVHHDEARADRRPRRAARR